MTFDNRNWELIGVLGKIAGVVGLAVLIIWLAFTMHSCAMERAVDNVLDRRLNNGEIIIVKPEG